MTPADSIHYGVGMLSVPMPLFAVAALVIAPMATPSGRRSLVLIYFLVGIAAAFVGAHVVEPIPEGGWNLQFLFYPFLFAKWFLIGFAAASAFGAINKPSAGPV